MSTTMGHGIGKPGGGIAFALLTLFLGLILRMTLAARRRRIAWVGVAVLAMALISIGLVASVARSASGSA